MVLRVRAIVDITMKRTEIIASNCGGVGSGLVWSEVVGCGWEWLV